MTRLEWKPEYSVGDAAADFEHEELIGQIDVLCEQLAGNVKPEQVEATLGEMLTGISAHFSLEETLMREAGYEEYDAHRNDHEDLLDQIRDMMDDFMDYPSTGTERLRNQLVDWFGRHFVSFDARLHNRLG